MSNISNNPPMPNSAQPDLAKGGFALIGVLVLTVLIATILPLMASLNRQTIASLIAEQITAQTHQQAQHLFSLAHSTMLLHGGLPLGWQRLAQADPSHIQDLMACSNLINAGGDIWDSPAGRISVLTTPDDNRRLIAGVYRMAQGQLPYARFVVVACVITPSGQASVMRGAFALSGGQMLLLRVESGAI